MAKTSESPAALAALSPEARALHSRLQKEWNIVDAAGGLALLTLCQALDRLREAQRMLAKDGIVLPDRWNQLKPHPACSVEREARSGMMQCLKAMNLDLESLEPEDEG